jgi:folate-binding Fe-S cluster repair protein YgfZ
MDILNSFFSTLYTGGLVDTSLSLIQVQGDDSFKFLQRQITNDLNALTNDDFFVASLLENNGGLNSWFSVFSQNEKYYLCVESELREKLISRLEKYIISEDVELTIVNLSFSVLTGLSCIAKYFQNKNSHWVLLPSGQRGLLVLNEDVSEKKVKSQDMDFLSVFNRMNHLKNACDQAEIINNTILMETSVDLNKGCFLGFETVSKIDSRKGASFYPCLLEVKKNENIEVGEKFYFDGKKVGKIVSKSMFNGNVIYEALLLRKYRVHGKKIEFETERKNNIAVTINTNQKILDKQTWLNNFYYYATDLYIRNEVEIAKNILKDIIKIDSNNLEFLESLGVLYSKEKEYLKSIELFHQAEKLFPESAMVFTNLSLNYMKIGEIETAEKYKEKSTLQAFLDQGKKIDAESRKEEQEKIKLAERSRRQEMFKEVLAIDPEDSMANIGLAEIYYELNDLERAESHTNIVLKNDPKYSQAYLLMGKIFITNKKNEEAKKVLKVGVEIASEKGEMMPANEMQSLLNSI